MTRYKSTIMKQLIFVPLNLGCEKQGTELAPEIIGYLFKQNINSSIRDGNIIINSPSFIEFGTIIKKDSMMFPDQIIDVCKKLNEACYNTASINDMPIILGGDHAVSWGSISGILRYYNDLSVVYIDAHGDCNIAESSPTGHIHGMHMSYLMNLGNPVYKDALGQEKIAKNDILYLGIRDLDPFEQDLLKNGNVCSSKDINESLDGVINKTNTFLKNRKHIHISLDIDVLDPKLCPGTGVPVPDGISLEKLNALLETVFINSNVVSMDLVEYNPLLDKDNKSLNCIKDIITHISKYI